MKATSAQRFCQIVEAHGWSLDQVRGSHQIFIQPGNPIILTVPVQGNRDLKRGTLGKLIKDSGIDESEL